MLFFSDRSFFVAGIDTKVHAKYGDGTEKYSFSCKITSLDATHFFMAIGRFGVIDQGVTYDVYSIAHDVAKTESTTAGIANAWDRVTADILSRVSPSALSKPGTNEIVSGVFFGIDAGEIAVRQDTFLLEANRPILKAQAIHPIQDYAWHIQQNHAELAAAFVHDNVTGMSDSPYKWANDLSGLRKYMISNSNDPEIGGDISIVIVRPNATAEWFSKPDVCK